MKTEVVTRCLDGSRREVLYIDRSSWCERNGEVTRYEVEGAG